MDIAHDGVRLDRYLAEAIPGASRSLLQKHIEQGAVRIAGLVPARGAKTLVRRGDAVDYTPPPPTPLDLVAEDIPVEILFEDPDLVVVNKPKGLVVHPAAGHATGTLVNALLHHVEEFEAPDDDARPGIVHRLDRDTTGVMVVAKNAEARRALVEAFGSRRVEKSYLAVVHGHPDPPKQTLDTFFGRHPRDRKKFTSRRADGKRAISHFETLARYVGAAYLAVRIETGRTHQIRVHLAEHGHPIIGDPLYGRRKDAFERPALHAHRLRFAHPRTGEALSFDAPLPEDIARLLESLGRPA